MRGWAWLGLITQVAKMLQALLIWPKQAKNVSRSATASGLASSGGAVFSLPMRQYPHTTMMAGKTLLEA